jgi:hypothetical protein
VLPGLTVPGPLRLVLGSGDVLIGHGFLGGVPTIMLAPAPKTGKVGSEAGKTPANIAAVQGDEAVHILVLTEGALKAFEDILAQFRLAFTEVKGEG